MARAMAAARSGTPSEGAASVLGKGVRIRGRVDGEGDLRVDGHVEGDVRVTGELVIGDGGGIAGDVEAASVIIDGELTGDVAARGAVRIRSTARVTGNMGGAEVSLDEGAAFAGRIEAEFDLPAELGKRR